MPYFFALPAGVKPVLTNYFKDKPTGSIIEYGSSLSGIPSQLSATGSYVLENSYIKLEKDVYVLGKGKEAIVGSGAFGTVTYVQSLSTGTGYVAKVQQFKPRKVGIQSITREVKSLRDLGLYRDDGLRKEDQSTFHYTIMPDVGMSLGKYLKARPELSNEARFDLAIQLNWALHNLHRGTASRTDTTYAHRDIKPQNITIGATGQIRLIDVGLCSPELDNFAIDLVGAPAYLPNMKTFFENKLTLRQLDVMALKRVMFMPDKVLCNLGYKEDTTGKHFGLPMILSKDLLTSSGLFKYFDTSVTGSDQNTMSEADFQGDPLSFASLLVLGRYGLVEPYAQKVMKNQTLAYAVLGMYFANQGMPDARLAAQISFGIKAYVLCRVVSRYRQAAEQIEVLGLLVKSGITNDLNVALENKTLIQLIKEPSPSVRKAAVLLWQNGFRDVTSLNQLKSNEPLAKKVIQFVFDGDLAAVRNVLLPILKVVKRVNLTSAQAASASSLLKQQPVSTARNLLKEKSKERPVVVRAKSQSSLKFPSVFFGAVKENQKSGEVGSRDAVIKLSQHLHTAASPRYPVIQA